MKWAQLPTESKLSAGLCALVLGQGSALGVSEVAQGRRALFPTSLCQKDFLGFVDVDPESSVPS